MLLILRSFPVREDALSRRLAAVRETAWIPALRFRGDKLRGNDAQTAATENRFEIPDFADSKNLQGDYGRKAATRYRFEIENLIQRLDKSKIDAGNVETQQYERSQEVVENKGKCFFHSLQSQEVYENARVILVKPRGY